MDLQRSVIKGWLMSRFVLICPTYRVHRPSTSCGKKEKGFHQLQSGQSANCISTRYCTTDHRVKNFSLEKFLYLCYSRTATRMLRRYINKKFSNKYRVTIIGANRRPALHVTGTRRYILHHLFLLHRCSLTQAMKLFICHLTRKRTCLRIHHVKIYMELGGIFVTYFVVIYNLSIQLEYPINFPSLCSYYFGVALHVPIEC